MSVQQEAERLRVLLSHEDLGPDDAEVFLPEVDDAVKDALVHLVAADPAASAPNGFLLSRLLLARTAGNADELAQVYRASVGSPDPGARTASLYGLHELELPEAVASAQAALDDADPQVVTAAADVLLRRAGQDASVRSLLAAAVEARGGDPAFRSATVLLRGHGIGEGPLEA